MLTGTGVTIVMAGVPTHIVRLSSLGELSTGLGMDFATWIDSVGRVTRVGRFGLVLIAVAECLIGCMLESDSTAKPERLNNPRMEMQQTEIDMKILTLAFLRIGFRKKRRRRRRLPIRRLRSYGQRSLLWRICWRW